MMNICVIKIFPLIAEISWHVKQVLTDGQRPDGRKNDRKAKCLRLLLA